jgi:hypothetical protein
MLTIEEIDRMIAEHERDLQVLKERKKEYLEMDVISDTPAGKLAIALHEKMCKNDHTEYCSWYYFARDGKHDWSEFAHNQYLTKARGIINQGFDVDNVISVLKVI